MRPFRRINECLRTVWRSAFRSPYMDQLRIHAEIRELRKEMSAITPDNPALKGFKVYSQFDEDGIIDEIFRRIGGGKTFVEIGCADGTENNTHYLVLKGWSGAWIDGSEQLLARIRKCVPEGQERLVILQKFIDRENVKELIPADVDFFSLDIDGNDLEVMRSIISRPVTPPKVLCVEYNGRFPPPLSIGIVYNPSHTWAGDDYMGASLQAFVDLLTGYKLVACTLTGGNAFFVRNDLAAPFADYTPSELYQPSRAHLIFVESGPRPTLKFLAAHIRPPQ